MFCIMNENNTEFLCVNTENGSRHWMTEKEIWGSLEDHEFQIFWKIKFKTKLEALNFCEADPSVGMNIVQDPIW